MRFVFDVDSDASVSGGGQAYRNRVGTQGADDAQMDVYLFLNKRDGDYVDEVEFHGSATQLVRLFQSALDIAQGTLDFVKQNGPVRPLPCPNCDPLTVYANATHTVECAHSKYWEAAPRDAYVPPQDDAPRA